jgi:hypothetical protein
MNTKTMRLAAGTFVMLGPAACGGLRRQRRQRR